MILAGNLVVALKIMGQVMLEAASNGNICKGEKEQKKKSVHIIHNQSQPFCP